MKRSLFVALFLISIAPLHAQRAYSLSVYGGFGFENSLSSSRPYRSLDQLFFVYDNQERARLVALSEQPTFIQSYPGGLFGITSQWLFGRKSGSSSRGFALSTDFSSHRFSSSQEVDVPSFKGESDLMMEERRLNFRVAYVEKWSKSTFSLGLKGSAVVQREGALTVRFLPKTSGEASRRYHLEASQLADTDAIGVHNNVIAPFFRYAYNLGPVHFFAQLDYTFITSDVDYGYFTALEHHGAEMLTVSLGASVALVDVE